MDRNDAICSLPYEKDIIFYFFKATNHTGLGSMVWFVCSVIELVEQGHAGHKKLLHTDCQLWCT